jgi:hypothetical protein
MQKTSLLNAIAACLLLTSTGLHSALPALSKLPWIGYFMVTKEKNFQITMSSNGSTVLYPITKSGNIATTYTDIKFQFSIIETLPDGKTVNRPINPVSLTSEQVAELGPKKPLVFKGKVEGDAAFEAIYYPERGGFSFGGKITEKGTLTNPLRFAVSATFTPYHINDKTDMVQFKKDVKKDDIRFETLERKREKVTFLDKTASSTTPPAPVTMAEISSQGINGLKFKLVPSRGTSLTIASKEGKCFYEGFTTVWQTDEKAGSAPQKISFVVK